MDNLTYYLEILKLEPDNIPALKGLSEVYKATQQWDKLIEIYEKLFTLAEEDDERINYILGVADIYVEKLQDNTKALEFYLDAIELNPSEQSALDKVQQILQNEGDIAGLTVLLEGKSLLTGDAEQKAGINAMVADNYMRLGRYDDALAFLAQFPVPPYEPTVHLYKKLAADGLASTLIEYRDLLASGLNNHDEIIALYQTLATLYGDTIQDPYESAYYYEMALAAGAADRSNILSTLQQIYTTFDDPVLMLSVLLPIQETAAPEQAFDIDKAIGLSYLRLDNPADALPFLERALALKPDDTSLLSTTLDIYTHQGASDNIESTLVKLIEAEDDRDKRIPLYTRVIPLLIEKKDYETAKQYITALVEITGDRSTDALLEQIYTDTQDYNGLVNFYLERLNGREDQKDSAPLWASLGDVYLKGFSHEEYAIDSYTRAAALDPDSLVYREKLAGLYQAAQRWPEAEQALVTLLPLITDGSKKLALQLALGNIYLSFTKDYERAAAIYTGICAADPRSVPALSALERIYRETGNYRDLAGILEKKLPLTDSAYDTLAELGSLLFDRDIDIQKAREYLWQALTLNPQSTDVVDVLKRLYETTGDYQGFEKLYSFLIDTTSPAGAARTELLLKLAHIRFDKLALPDKAIETFEQIISLEPDNADARLSLASLYFNAGNWEKAVVHLGYSIDRNIVPLEHLPEFLFKYARTLDKLGRQQDSLHLYQRAFDLNSSEKRYAEAYGYSAFTNHEYAGVIKAFETLQRISADLENRTDIYKKLASAYEEQKDYRAATIYLMKLTEIEPSNRDYFQWLERLCTLGSDHALLASVLKKESELSTSDAEVLALTMRRASIQEENLGDTKSAIKTLEDLIKSGKKNVDVYLQLISLYKKLNSTNNLVQALEETLTFELSAEQKVGLLLELAGLLSDDQQKAAGLYNQVLSLRSDNAAAFIALERIYGNLGDYPALSALYANKLRTTLAPDEKLDLQKKLASLKTEHLQDLPGAVVLYRDILRDQPSDSGTYSALEQILLKQGDFQALNELYQNGAKNIPAKDSKLVFLKKSAELLLHTLHDGKAAIQSYEAVLALDNSNSDILLKAARLAVSEQLADKAVVFYKQAARLTDLPDESKAEINFEYGNLLKDKGSQNEAYHAYKAAHTLNPSSIDYRLAYGESAYANGLYKEAYDTLKNITYAHENELLPGQLLPLYKTLSDTAKRLGDIQQAVEYLIRAVDIDGKDIGSLITLDELTSTLGNYELEIEVLTKLSKITEKPSDRAQVLIKIAKLKHDKTYDLNGAVPLLREAMAILPENIQIYNELIQIYREQSNVDNEIEILLKLLSIEKNSRNFVTAAMRLGDVYIEFKNDMDTAKKYYLEALKKEPSSIPVIRGLGKIFELQDNLAGKAELYQKFVKVLLPKEPKEVLPLVRELGELYAVKINNPELAIQQYQTILNVDPSDINAHSALAELLSRNKAMTTDAVREYGIVLKYDPVNMSAIRFLAKYYEQKKDYDRVFVYWSTLKLLGEEKDLERIFVEANKGKQPQLPKLPVTDDLFVSHITHIKTRGPLKDILNVFPDYGGSLFKPDIKLYGVGKQDRVTAKSPAWHEYGPLVQALGIKDLDVYQTTNGNFKPAIENTDPPSLIVHGPSLSGFTPKERSFILAEYLTSLRAGFVLPGKLGKQKFTLFIDALVKVLNPSATTPDDKNPNLQAVIGALSTMLTKKQRAALDEPVKKYLKMPAQYIDEWFKGIEMTGVRTAIFLTGDPEPIFSALIKWHIGDTALLSNKEKRKDIFMTSELMQDALQFYLSDGHFLLRNKLGMSILSV